MNFSAILLEATANKSSGVGLISMLIIYGLIFFALWFFMIRPQKKK